MKDQKCIYNKRWTLAKETWKADIWGEGGKGEVVLRLRNYLPRHVELDNIFHNR